MQRYTSLGNKEADKLHIMQLKYIKIINKIF